MIEKKIEKIWRNLKLINDDNDEWAHWVDVINCTADSWDDELLRFHCVDREKYPFWASTKRHLQRKEETLVADSGCQIRPSDVEGFSAHQLKVCGTRLDKFPRNTCNSFRPSRFRPFEQDWRHGADWEILFALFFDEKIREGSIDGANVWVYHEKGKRKNFYVEAAARAYRFYRVSLRLLGALSQGRVRALLVGEDGAWNRVPYQFWRNKSPEFVEKMHKFLMTDKIDGMDCFLFLPDVQLKPDDSMDSIVSERAWYDR